jgi:hypothetical protein
MAGKYRSSMETITRMLTTMKPMPAAFRVFS